MKERVKKLIEDNQGELIYFDNKSKIVLWSVEDEFRVHRVVENNKELSLSNGDYSNNIDDAMLKYLERKGVALNIDLKFTECDLDILNNNETMDWTFNDKKSGIQVNVHLFKDNKSDDEE